MTHPQLATIEQIIDDARNGHMFILVDDEDRENEGDLVIPAQMATPDAINFMATHGRGLICLAMTRERISHLRLPLMAQQNQSRHQTAFTVSIEAKEGVTTGISAPDRARTIAAAIDAESTHEDICTPGHVFPLVACNGGVLVRAGHTEAAVDIARLAGMNPSGVICEIMKDDGTMARLPDLMEFAARHKLNVATIADLISYRRRYDTLVERVYQEPFDTHYGEGFQLMVYRNTIEDIEHIALVKGSPSADQPVLVRMHALDIMHDVLGDRYGNRGGELERSLAIIDKAGCGAVILLREAVRSKLSDKLRARHDDSHTHSHALRDYGIGAQILLDLGIRRMTLLSNSQPQVVGLEGYGLSIEGCQPIG